MLQATQAPVLVFSLHPGVVYTDLWTNVDWVKIFTLISRMIMKTAEQGGDTLVHAPLDPDLTASSSTWRTVDQPETAASPAWWRTRPS